jgi:XTP/dITP diphosphohydrolase
VQVVLATRNAGKVREVRAILAALPIQLIALPEGIALPPEGDTYEANAVDKAVAAARATGHLSIADDSGLEVDALGGAPGALSARYGADDAARISRMLAALVGVPDAARGARFVCVAAWATADGRSGTARGVCEGRILRAASGAGGFGYDPIFGVGPGPASRSMAELSPAEKDALSHRGHAFRALAAVLPGIDAPH